MRIIISENQHTLLRRIQDFINIVEEEIEGYEKNDNNSWWCESFNGFMREPQDKFVDYIIDTSIDRLVEKNWHFFHDHSEEGGSDMDISLLNNIFEQNYGNYVRNLFVRKCNQSRF